MADFAVLARYLIAAEILMLKQKQMLTYDAKTWHWVILTWTISTTDQQLLIPCHLFPDVQRQHKPYQHTTWINVTSRDELEDSSFFNLMCKSYWLCIFSVIKLPNRMDSNTFYYTISCCFFLYIFIWPSEQKQNNHC